MSSEPNLDDLLYGVNLNSSHQQQVADWQRLRMKLEKTMYLPGQLKPQSIATERDLQMFLAESLSQMNLMVLVEFPLFGTGRIDLLLPQIELGIEVKLDVSWNEYFPLRYQLGKYEEALGWEVICVARSGKGTMQIKQFKKFLAKKMQEISPQPWPPYVYTNPKEKS